MKKNIDGVSFRKAEKKDLKLVISFAKKLAEHVDLMEEVNINEDDFSKWVFDEKTANVIFLIKDGKEIGFALYLYLFASFNCKPTLYLEDIYIDEKYRNRGYGKLIFKQLAKIAKENDLNRIEWTCLDENKKGLVFYNSLGSKKLDDRRLIRLEKEDLDNFLA